MSGEITYSDGKTTIHRRMTDDELKCMLNNIRLNTGFSFPDQLIQDFMDGDIVPTFKKCLHFNRDDFKTLVHPIKKKKERKRIPKPKTKRKSEKSTSEKSTSMKPKKPKSTTGKINIKRKRK
jgi:hypothetical protein